MKYKMSVLVKTLMIPILALSVFSLEIILLLDHFAIGSLYIFVMIISIKTVHTKKGYQASLLLTSSLMLLSYFYCIDSTTDLTAFTVNRIMTLAILIFTYCVANCKLESEQIAKQYNRELEEQKKDLEYFAYVASHDLKEPLRKINSYCHLLEDEFSPDITNDNTKYFISSIKEATNRLHILITNLLKFSQVGNTTLKRYVLRDVIKTVINDLENTISEVKAVINIDFDSSVTVQADLNLLYCAIQNILSNGLKFVAKGQKPIINIYITDSKDLWNIHFKDNGIGINEKYLKKIFEIFQRLNNKSEYRGTGVGLAITMKSVTAMNGSLTVSSNEFEGSIFTISLPKGI